MKAERVDYDRVAPGYHRRYATSRQENVAAALRALGEEPGVERILTRRQGKPCAFSNPIPPLKSTKSSSSRPTLFATTGARPSWSARAC